MAITGNAGGKREQGLGNRGNKELDPRLREDDNDGDATSPESLITSACGVASGATAPDWLLELIEKHAEESLREFEDGDAREPQGNPLDPRFHEDDRDGGDWLTEYIDNIRIDGLPFHGNPCFELSPEARQRRR